MPPTTSACRKPPTATVDRGSDDVDTREPTRIILPCRRHDRPAHGAYLGVSRDPSPPPGTPDAPAAPGPRPRHVACIMDGNGRWAAARGLPRTAGHSEGEENIARLVRVAVRRDIGWLTLFGFSTENWVRPRTEVRHILGLHEKLFGRLAELNELGVRVQWIGRPFDAPDARTPRYVQRAIRKAIADTSHNTGMVLTIAFDYGGRRELCDAVAGVRPRSADDAGGHLVAALPSLSCRPSTCSSARAASGGCPTSCCGSRPAPRSASPTVPWPEFDEHELDRALELVT
ncbi:MAG: polyprenyl diphosphate synthase [Ilumatobacteraceae bacterium]